MTTTLHVGHVLDVLRAMPDRSVHMAWSSPPYWGLRSYGTEPQVWGGDPACQHAWSEPVPRRGGAGRKGKNSLMQSRSVSDAQVEANQQSRGCWCRCGAWRGEHGLEPSFDLWLAHEVAIWAEVRRVLRDDGTVWINIGDAYASTPNGISAAETRARGDDRAFRDRPIDTTGGMFKPKDRMLMPARLAIALQADGWWLRDEIVWSKPNPMPSSIKDRTTPAHETIYLLSKKARYFYDHVAVLEPFADGRMGCDYPRPNAPDKIKSPYGQGFTRRAEQARRTPQPAGWNDGDGADGQFHPEGRRPEAERNRGGREDGFTKPNDIDPSANGGRNKRSVWPIPLEPFPGAHFATAPTALVRPCILAGTSAKGVCPACGAPWRRVASSSFEPQPDAPASAAREDRIGDRTFSRRDGSVRGTVSHATTGWTPTCECDAGKPVPATVLDPFFGAGTTGLVADELGRDCIGIELNPAYAELARERIRDALGRVDSGLAEPDGGDLPLFAAAGG